MCVCAWVHTRSTATSLQRSWTLGGDWFQPVSPQCLYLLVNYEAVALTPLLLTVLLLLPLKSAKCHVDLVSLVEIWSLSQGNLEEMVSVLTLQMEQTSLIAKNAMDLGGFVSCDWRWFGPMLPGC